MTRVLVLVLATSVLGLAGACSQASGLAPEDAYAAAGDAIRAGEAEQAVSLLDEAARAGHLGALRSLAHAYDTGGLSVGLHGPSDVLVIARSDRRAHRYRTAYDLALADSVRAGRPDALLHAAVEMLGVRMVVTRREDLPAEIRARYWDAVDLDSVRALYGRIDGAALNGPGVLLLAQLGQALGDTTAAMRLYDRAVADGDPGACIYKVQAEHGAPDLFSAAGLAAHADQMAACAEHWPQPGYLDGVRRSARNGAARSAEVLDSLETLGLFRRYPHLVEAR